LTPAAIEAVLADFRSWLQHLSSAPPGQSAQEQAQAVDLHTLLGQFVAVRHEVNLQTKAARSQQEQTGLALQQLGQALESGRQAQAAAQQANQQTRDEALKPLLKTLLDVHDAFSLAQRETGRTRENILPLLDELAYEPLPLQDGSSNSEVQLLPELTPLPGSDVALAAGDGPQSASRPEPSVWQRWFGWSHNQTRVAGQSSTFAKMQAQQQRLLARLEEQRTAMADQHEQYRRLLESQKEQRQRERIAHQQQQGQLAQAVERVDQLIDSVVTGYQMSLQRLERALQQAGLEPIPCAGELFDPEQMEVVAAVADSGRPAGEVIEEVRRGYLWRGRVFRYAQVSVAKTDKETRRQGDEET
jgi:molecular chaperone GrpE